MLRAGLIQVQEMKVNFETEMATVQATTPPCPSTYRFPYCTIASCPPSHRTVQPRCRLRPARGASAPKLLGGSTPPPRRPRADAAGAHGGSGCWRRSS